MTKKMISNILLLAAVAVALVFGGKRLYMNIRPADPIMPGWEDYSDARFGDLMTKDAPVLVEIYASWCPTCLAQQHAFKELQKQGKALKIRAVRVDFDRDKTFITQHGYKATGYLAIYRKGTEVARAGGLVTPDAITGFLRSNGVGE